MPQENPITPTPKNTTKGAWNIEVLVTRLNPDVQLPYRGTNDAAGWDLHSITTLTLEPHARALIPTGLAIALPRGYEMQIRPRSGLALRHGVTLLNAPGTIDADYRGEIKILMINHGDVAFTILKGMRIAQAVVARFATLTWKETLELPPTFRGKHGFGHTGE